MQRPDKAVKSLRVGRERRVADDDGGGGSVVKPAPFMREALTAAQSVFITFIFKFLSEMSEMIDVSPLLLEETFSPAAFKGGKTHFHSCHCGSLFMSLCATEKQLYLTEGRK